MPLFNELTNKIKNLLFQIEKAIEIEEQINNACHVALTKRPYYSVWKLLCSAKEQLKAWAKQPNIEQITAMHEKLKDIENDIRVQKNPSLWLNAIKYKKTNNSELLAKINNIKNMPNISKNEIRNIIVNLITNIENKIAVENMFYDYSGGDVPDTPPHMWTAILVHKLKQKFAQNENEWNIKQLWTLKIELATIMEEINTTDKWCWSSAKKYEKADNPELLAKMEKMITNNINESSKYYKIKREQCLSDFIARKIQATKEKIAAIDEAIKIETMIFEAHEIVGIAITTNDFTDLQNALTVIKKNLTAENNLKIKDLLKLGVELDKMQLKIDATDPATMWSNARKYEKTDNPELLKKITIIETSSNTEKKIINEIKTLIVAIDNKITVERMVYLVNTKQNDIPSDTPYFSFQNSLEIFTQQLQKETLNLEQLGKIKNKLETMNLEINVTGPVAMWNNARKYKTATNSELLTKIHAIIALNNNTENIKKEIKILKTIITEAIQIEKMLYKAYEVAGGDLPCTPSYFSAEVSSSKILKKLKVGNLNTEQLLNIKNKLMIITAEINYKPHWSNARKYQTATNPKLLVKIAKIKTKTNIIAAANTLEETLQACTKNKEKCCVLL